MSKLTTPAIFIFAVTMLSSCKDDFLAKNENGFIIPIVLIVIIAIVTIAVLKKAKLF